MERLSGDGGSLSEAALNQRTGDHILEMFSLGLLSQVELELHAPRVLFKSDSGAMKGIWRPWERGWGLC